MDQLVDPNKRAQMEYSAQFFGFSPDSFIDTMIGNCTEIVESHLQASNPPVPFAATAMLIKMCGGA